MASESVESKVLKDRKDWKTKKYEHKSILSGLLYLSDGCITVI